MITVKQLGYALAVEKTRHFKKAADACSVSQSALSTAISELESQIGMQIFERDNKRVLVTKSGERFLDKARLIKTQMDELYLLAKIENTPLSYPVSMGVIPTIGPYLLPKVLPEVRKTYPDLALTITESQSQILLERVRNGELDTAVVALPYDVSGLHCFEFWTEDFFLVTHSSNVLAKCQQIDKDMLEKASLLLLEDGHCLKDHALAACSLQRVQQQKLEGTSLYTLLQMVAGGLGSTFVPEMALSSLRSQSSELVPVKLAQKGPHRKLALVARMHYSGSDNLLLLAKLFKRALEGVQSSRVGDMERRAHIRS